MNLKLLVIPAVGILIMLGMFVRNDSRTLHIEENDLPVNRTLAIDISKRYLAGWWKPSKKLDETPYAAKDVFQMSDEVIVELIDERDSSSCEGYEIIINKNTGSVKSKEDINYCR